MNKINFAGNLKKKGFLMKKFFKIFFKQIYQNEEKEAEYIKNSEASLDVKKIYYLKI